MKADPRWDQFSPGKLHWDAYPFKSYSDQFPDSGTWANNPLTLHQAINRPPRPAVEPTESDIAILSEHFPEADPTDPPFESIRVKLILGGIAPPILDQCDSREIVRLLAKQPKAHQEKIFPTGTDGIEPDLVCIAVEINNRFPKESKATISREYYKACKDCIDLANNALHRIRSLESKRRIVLPKKRTRRTTS